MEQKLSNTKKPAKNMRYYMRFLHNNIGFFIVGLVVIYSLSGILQIYRDTDLLNNHLLRRWVESIGQSPLKTSED